MLEAKKLVELFLIVELWGYLLSTVVCASLNISQLGVATKGAVALSISGAFILSFVPAKLLAKVNVFSNLVFITSAFLSLRRTEFKTTSTLFLYLSLYVCITL